MAFPSYDCLIDQIGVKGCSQPTPPSGLFINDLPGITLRGIDKIATEDDANFLGVWATVQKRAAIRFRRDVIAKFAKRYKLKTLTTSLDIGRLIDAASSVAPSNDWRGTTYEVNEKDAQFVASNLQQFYIANLSLYDKGSGNAVTIKIFDLDLGIELFTTTIASTVVGWNVVAVNQSIDARRIFIAYDANTITAVNQDFTKVKNAVNTHGCWRVCTTHCGCDMTVKSAVTDITTGDVTAPTENNDAFGLSVQISVKCSFEKIICRNIECFINAWWYLCAIELMRERLYTDRLNEFTAFDRNDAQQLHDLFMIDYKGGLVNDIWREGELQIAIKGINLNLNDCCLECNAKVSMQEQLP